MSSAAPGHAPVAEAERGDRSSYVLHLLVCAVVSLVVHLLLSRGAGWLPPEASAPARPTLVQVRLTTPPPEPAEEPAAPEEAPTTPLPTEPLERPRSPRPPLHAALQVAVARDSAPSERASSTGDGPATPVFGISMESTSQAGTGPALPVGNTLQVQPSHDLRPSTGPVAPLPPPVAAYEVTRMPVPQGRCSGHYTPQAREAGVEGTVILDLVVGADGVPRDIRVEQGLSHGLTEAAVAALRACRFTPGERSGTRVPVRVRRFRITFLLQNGG